MKESSLKGGEWCSDDAFDDLMNNHNGLWLYETSTYEAITFEFSEGIITICLLVTKKPKRKEVYRKAIYWIEFIVGSFVEFDLYQEGYRTCLPLIPMFEQKADEYFENKSKAEALRAQSELLQTQTDHYKEGGIKRRRGKH